jgi:hypothetical protein
LFCIINLNNLLITSKQFWEVIIMNSKIFLATNGPGLARATCGYDGGWSVEFVEPDLDVRCLAADPLNPNIVYAGTQTRGVFRSEDKGSSWSPVGLSRQMVKSLAVSYHQPGVVYAGLKPASIFISKDSGEEWQELKSFQNIRGRRFWRSPAEPPDWRAYVMGLSLSPVDKNLIVAGIEFGAVVVSQDGGKTWSNHRKGALRDCHTLKFNPRNGKWVYEAGGGGAAVSSDGGNSWRQPKSGLDKRYGWSCAADPERPEVWYISSSPFSAGGLSFEPAAHVLGRSNAAIYRSAGGAAWEKLGGGLPDPLNYMANDLVTDPDAPGHIYAGLANGDVWHSANYGDTWSQMPFNLMGVQRLLILG